MHSCIDVERRYPKYKTGYEDPAFEQARDPWHKVIVCRAGHISPAGGDKLWACTKNRKSVAAKSFISGKVPCKIKMDGSDGVNVEFNASDDIAATVFKLMGAKKR